MPYLVIHAELDEDDFGNRTVIGGVDTDPDVINGTDATLKPVYKSSSKYYASPYKAPVVLKLLEQMDYIVVASCMIGNETFWTLKKEVNGEEIM